jgi:hypothetical protein
VIRRTDDLTGSRRGPDWRRPLAGSLVAAVALAVPVNLPRSDNCDGRFQQACAEPSLAPSFQVPVFTMPPISVPTFSPLDLPTFSAAVP